MQIEILNSYYFNSTVHITGYYEIHAGSRSSNINAYIIAKDRNGDELDKKMINIGNELKKAIPFDISFNFNNTKFYTIEIWDEDAGDWGFFISNPSCYLEK